MIYTEWLGGMTFVNVAGPDADWISPENVGSSNDGANATAPSAISDWLEGTSGFPSLELPEGATVEDIEVEVYIGPTGGIFGTGKTLAVSLASGGDGPIGLSQTTRLDIINPGNNWFPFSGSPAEWDIESELAEWIAEPSVALKHSASGTGTLRIDAVRFRVGYSVPSSNPVGTRAPKLAGGINVGI